jgi:hypothetical protein
LRTAHRVNAGTGRCFKFLTADFHPRLCFLAGESLPDEQVKRIRILSMHYDPDSSYGYVKGEIFNGSDYRLTEVSVRFTVTLLGGTLATRELTSHLTVKPGFSGSFAESTYIRRSDVKVRFEIVGATGVFSGSGSGKRHPAISVRSKATLEELGRVWKKRD